jgi:hypothetical protein
MTPEGLAAMRHDQEMWKWLLSDHATPLKFHYIRQPRAKVRSLPIPDVRQHAQFAAVSSLSWHRDVA